jgi:hypothetical protein
MTVIFPAVSLAEYAHRIGYRDCAFFGVNHPNNDQYACREIWSLAQRQAIEMSLLQAQDMVERAASFFFVPKWVVDEEHKFNRYQMLNWCYLIDVGVMTDTVISAAIVPGFVNDPEVITIPNVTCAIDDIHVMFGGTEQEITPTVKTLAAGVLTLEIPWCRLVDPAYQDNPLYGLEYADIATWGAASVDVRCLTNDDTSYMTLHRREYCNCDDYAGTGCAYIRNHKLSFLSIVPSTVFCGCWDWGTISYLSGKTTLTQQDKDCIIRLAHSLMPDEPCGCTITQRLWQRDRRVPEILTRERLNCPFGMSDGAWNTWSYVNNIKVVRGGLWQ